MPSVRSRWKERLSSFHSPFSSSSSSSSSSPNSKIIELPPPEFVCPLSSMTSSPKSCELEDPLAEEIVSGLKHAQISVRESALINLRHSSRETKERQIALCTPKLLSSLLPFLLSRDPSLQTNAAASLVNLSIEPSNKIKIVRSGALPHLVDVLKNGDPAARDHAAGAVFSLALEEDNRLAIGVLGAVPPLVHLFYQNNASHLARKESGMAIYYLTLAANNAAKLAKTPGATRAVLRVATEKESREAVELRRVAMMIVGNLAGRPEGRAGLMDAGAVGTVLRMMKEGAGREEEHCIGILYGLSRGGSLRFRSLAKAAGAEEVLKEVTGNGEIGKEMVRRVRRMVRGDEEGAVLGDEDEEVGTVVSEGLVSFRRRYDDFGYGSGHASDFQIALWHSIGSIKTRLDSFEGSVWRLTDGEPKSRKDSNRPKKAGLPTEAGGCRAFGR